MVSSVIRKYAWALAEVAGELEQEEKVHAGLLAFQDALNSHAELEEILNNPAVPFSSRRWIVEALGKRLTLPQAVVNFVLILLERGRFHQFEAAVEAYHEVLDERRGIVRGEVFSSRELGREVREKLQKAVSRLTGREVRIDYHLDDSLIGGFKLQIGSTVYDGSVRTQLEEIRRRLVAR